MIRPIVTYDVDSPENPPVLTQKTRRVTDFRSPEVVSCVQDLNDTLDELIRTEGNKRGAIGLSATQIGVDLAISAVTLGSQRYMFINPVLAEERGHDRLFRIGCFSLIKYRAMVRYNDDVVIRYFDPTGAEQTVELTGDRSCVVQHEMDHLEGILLFERAEQDLFVPRESLYRDGKIPPENHGPVFEENRRAGLLKPMSGPVFYSSLFNDYSDYRKLVTDEAKDKAQLLQTVEVHTRKGGSILEVGNGTGALAVELSKRGYSLTCAQSDGDMLDLARRISGQNGTDVQFLLRPATDLGCRESVFDTVVSHQVLESLSDADLLKALEEGLRAAKTYIFQVPTILHAGNDLRGTEHLRPMAEWEALLTSGGLRVAQCIPLHDGGEVIFVVTK